MGWQTNATVLHTATITSCIAYTRSYTYCSPLLPPLQASCRPLTPGTSCSETRIPAAHDINLISIRLHSMSCYGSSDPTHTAFILPLLLAAKELPQLPNTINMKLQHLCFVDRTYRLVVLGKPPFALPPQWHRLVQANTPPVAHTGAECDEAR